MAALYAEHALGLTRLAQVMLGNRVWTPGDEALDSAAPGVDGPLLASEDRRVVLAALRRLPHRQREVLVLRYCLELSDAEIARTLGIGESTVRSCPSRAGGCRGSPGR